MTDADRRAPLDDLRSMESVRGWLGLDLWQGLGHDFTEWAGWTADVWADMIAEVRALRATPAPLDVERLAILRAALDEETP